LGLPSFQLRGSSAPFGFAIKSLFFSSFFPRFAGGFAVKMVFFYSGQTIQAGCNDNNPDKLLGVGSAFHKSGEEFAVDFFCAGRR